MMNTSSSMQMAPAKSTDHLFMVSSRASTNDDRVGDDEGDDTFAGSESRGASTNNDHNVDDDTNSLAESEYGDAKRDRAEQLNYLKGKYGEHGYQNYFLDEEPISSDFRRWFADRAQGINERYGGRGLSRWGFTPQEHRNEQTAVQYLIDQEQRCSNFLEASDGGAEETREMVQQMEEAQRLVTKLLTDESAEAASLQRLLQDLAVAEADQSSGGSIFTGIEKKHFEATATIKKQEVQNAQLRLAEVQKRLVALRDALAFGGCSRTQGPAGSATPQVLTQELRQEPYVRFDIRKAQDTQWKRLSDHHERRRLERDALVIHMDHIVGPLLQRVFVKERNALLSCPLLHQFATTVGIDPTWLVASGWCGNAGKTALRDRKKLEQLYDTKLKQKHRGTLDIEVERTKAIKDAYEKKHAMGSMNELDNRLLKAYLQEDQILAELKFCSDSARKAESCWSRFMRHHNFPDRLYKSCEETRLSLEVALKHEKVRDVEEERNGAYSSKFRWEDVHRSGNVDAGEEFIPADFLFDAPTTRARRPSVCASLRCCRRRGESATSRESALLDDTSMDGVASWEDLLVADLRKLGVSLETQQLVVKDTKTVVGGTTPSSRAEALKTAITAAKEPLENASSVDVGARTDNVPSWATCGANGGEPQFVQMPGRVPTNPSQVELNEFAIKRFYDKFLGGSVDVSSKLAILRNKIVTKAQGFPANKFGTKGNTTGDLALQLFRESQAQRQKIARYDRGGYLNMWVHYFNTSMHEAGEMKKSN